MFQFNLNDRLTLHSVCRKGGTGAVPGLDLYVSFFALIAAV